MNTVPVTTLARISGRTYLHMKENPLRFSALWRWSLWGKASKMADMVPGNEREIYNKKGNVLIIYGFQGDAGFITSSINAFSRIRKGCLSPPSSRGDRDRSTISTGDPLQLPLDDDNSFSISYISHLTQRYTEPDVHLRLRLCPACRTK